MGIRERRRRSWGAAEEFSGEARGTTLDVDLKGVFMCSQAEAQLMLPRGSGSIISTATRHDLVIDGEYLLW